MDGTAKSQIVPKPDQHAAQSAASPSWDAYAVWRVRVKDGCTADPAISSTSGWDPYEVWRTRVKRSR